MARCRCVCNKLSGIQNQINNLQDQINMISDTDDQQLSLVGNSLILEDGGSVDLSPFLDNTDDQIITAFNLSPAGILTLTIEDGNTVIVDLTSINTDDQTLSLAGTLLSIANGNSVDLSAFLDDTDISNVDLNLVGNDLTVSVTEDGVVMSDTVTLPSGGGGTLVPVYRTIYQEWSAGGSQNGLQSGAWGRMAAVIRLGVGRWRVTWPGAHPDGTNYSIDFGVGESGTLRDVPKISWIEGTKTPNGFELQITVDDNGASADTLTDAHWSYSVDFPFQMLEDVTLV